MFSVGKITWLVSRICKELLFLRLFSLYLNITLIFARISRTIHINTEESYEFGSVCSFIYICPKLFLKWGHYFFLKLGSVQDPIHRFIRTPNFIVTSENFLTNYQWVSISGLFSRFTCLGIYRDGCRTAATSKMKRFVTIVNGWKPLTIIKKRSVLDVAAVLDPPLIYRHTEVCS